MFKWEPPFGSRTPTAQLHNKILDAGLLTESGMLRVPALMTQRWKVSLVKRLEADTSWENEKLFQYQ